MTDYILPDEFPAIWASDWGEDDSGLWMAFTYKGIRQGFRWIQPGSFMMGSPADEPGRYNDETRHRVSLNRGFWMAETTCTQALWALVMGNNTSRFIGGNPSHFRGAELPVERVTWRETQYFFDALNSQFKQLDLRLPTEAEWEYACRAGTQTPFNLGDMITPQQVNYDGKRPYPGGATDLYREETVEVTALPKNPWGLYQMHGNVMEWCSDWYGSYPIQPVNDPKGPGLGWRRVLRGGGWLSSGRHVRSALRSRGVSSSRLDGVGFRFVLSA